MHGTAVPWNPQILYRCRGINTEFGAGTFWLWNVLGSMICVGPFIFLHKLCQTMNAACENYNRTGR